MINVSDLIKDLKRFEKAYPDANVTCCLPDGTLCFADGVYQDEDGEVCIRLEEEDEETVCCDGETIGEYEEQEYDSGWLSEADRRRWRRMPGKKGGRTGSNTWHC